MEKRGGSQASSGGIREPRVTRPSRRCMLFVKHTLTRSIQERLPCAGLHGDDRDRMTYDIVPLASHPRALAQNDS